jgi:hypothetical protein
MPYDGEKRKKYKVIGQAQPRAFVFLRKVIAQHDPEKNSDGAHNPRVTQLERNRCCPASGFDGKMDARRACARIAQHECPHCAARVSPRRRQRA